jgi:hypothetical protein
MRELRAAFADVDDVRDGLQLAIELELTTIPPYLYALWSIRDGRSRAAMLIQSIVVDEMLHLALAANILNAIGGAPRLTGTGVSPTYPASLPGRVHHGLQVHLRRCDRAQLEVFKRVETPEEPVDVRALSAEAPVTIGQFYDGIARKLHELGPGVFNGDPGRQLRRWPSAGQIRAIDGPAAAQWAIDLIKEQGEGASSHDPTDRDGDLGHFYRFWEIQEGREIVLTDGTWAFAGEGIPLPETHPLVDDPVLSDLPEGSRARVVAEAWNGTYGATLRSLERTFDGEPHRLNEALGLMYSLRVQAVDLFGHPSGRGDGTVAGPTFDYTG